MNNEQLANSGLVSKHISLPLELIEDTLDLLLNPKRIISSNDEIVLDWNKRTQIYNRLFAIVKEDMQF